MSLKGLVIVSGGAGTGKSTTLSSMVEHRNIYSKGHILCVADPIEFIHRNKRSIVTQREVGIDTESYEMALKNGLRHNQEYAFIIEELFPKVSNKVVVKNLLKTIL